MERQATRNRNALPLSAYAPGNIYNGLLLRRAIPHASDNVLQQSALVVLANASSDGDILVDTQQLPRNGNRLVLTQDNGEAHPGMQVLLDHLRPGLTRDDVERSLQASNRIANINSEMLPLQNALLRLQPTPDPEAAAEARLELSNAEAARNASAAQENSLRNEYQTLREARHFQRLRDASAANRSADEQREFESLSAIAYDKLSTDDQAKFKRLGGFNEDQAVKYSEFAVFRQDIQVIAYNNPPDKLDERIAATGASLKTARTETERLDMVLEPLRARVESLTTLAPSPTAETTERIKSLQNDLNVLAERRREAEREELSLLNMVDPERQAEFLGALGRLNMPGAQYMAANPTTGESTVFVTNGLDGETEIVIGSRAR
ncbi:MAG: hypothetical protein K2Q01_03990 [Rickettsiales bacterium]|nr:hypothetical protein [Rickettsiales bacterium]